MSKLSRLSHAGLAKETVMGTAVAPTLFAPWTTFDPEDDIAPLRDESVKANDTVLQGQYPGALTSMISLSGKCYPTLVGFLLRAFGLGDSVGAAVSGLYPHTMKSTGAQPPTYTITDTLPGVSARAYPGCMLSELTFKIDTQGEATFDSKWKGWGSATATPPTPSYAAEEPFLGWQLGWSAASVASTKVKDTTFSLKREVDILTGSDALQSPRETFAGGIELDASGSAFFEDETDLTRFLGYATGAVVMSLTKPVGRGGESLTLTTTKAVWMKAKPNRGAKYAMLDFAIVGTYSATDAGPVQALLSNLQSGAY